MTTLKFEDILTEAFLKQRYLEEKRSALAIAAEVGASETTVCNYLRRFTIPLRTRARRSANVDSSGFDELSTDWHAYWIGFLAADGCIYIDEKKNERRVQVVLHIADADHLRNLQHGLKADIPVACGYNGQRHIAKLILHDPHLVIALAKWGVVPNKTLTLSWPDHLPSSLVPAYIRGYFDGDGTIYQRHRNQPGTNWTETICRFISGSTPFLEGLTQELNQQGIQTNSIYRNQQSNAFVLPVSGRRENLLAFADLIYTECTVCLERKRAIFREMEAYHAAHPRKGPHLRYQAGSS